jgi:acyl-CoA thioester hydrolase
MTMPAHRTVPPLSAFPSVVTETLRFADTDRLGHVNNAVYATFCEIGRTGLLLDPVTGVGDADCDYPIARLELDFLAELHWPGEVAIGTGVTRVGRSSMTLMNAVYAGERPVAKAETVIVQIDRETRAARPIPEAMREALAGLTVSADASGSGDG